MTYFILAPEHGQIMTTWSREMNNIQGAEFKRAATNPAVRAGIGENRPNALKLFGLDFLEITVIVLHSFTLPMPGLSLLTEIGTGIATLDLFRRRGMAVASGAVVMAILVSVSQGGVFVSSLMSKTALAGALFCITYKYSRNTTWAFWGAFAGTGLAVIAIYQSGGEAFSLAFQELAQDWNSSLKSSMDILNYNASAKAEFLESMKSTMDMVLWYLPGMMTLSSLMYVGLGWLVLGHYSKPHDRLPSVANFLDWKINFSFLITLTALFVIRLIASLMEIDALNQTLDNSLLVIGALFTLGGMSLSKWFLKRIKAPLIIRIIFYLALALSLHLGMIFLAVLGIIDTQFDLRKRINQPELS